MKIRFLGGAGEVGASCILVTTESGKNILLDAGVRVSEEGTEMLPNLEPLNDIALDAIVLSHAHLDHSGALPLVAKLSPGASIYATTFSVTGIFAGDLRVEGETLYPIELNGRQVYIPAYKCGRGQMVVWNNIENPLVLEYKPFGIPLVTGVFGWKAESISIGGGQL
jgi:predicted metal-dependent RNase